MSTLRPRLTYLTVLTIISSLSACLAANLTAAGLAWANDLWVPMGGFTSPNTSISSYYTWSPHPVVPSPQDPPSFSVPFDFVPMLWGCTDDYIAAFNTAVTRNFNNVTLTKDRDILGFNEPDLAVQSNCSPRRAAEVWKSTLEPLKAKGYRLGSPAVTGGPGGKEWMRQWFKACEGGCNPDFVAVHWYDIDARDFIEHIQDYYWTFGRPIWVTEYAVMNFTAIDPITTTYDNQATLIQIELFMDITRNYMESVDWVERYFFFGAMYDMQGVNPLNTLFDVSGRDRRTGALNALGVQYARSNGSVSADGTRRIPSGDNGARAKRQGWLLPWATSCAALIANLLIV